MSPTPLSSLALSKLGGRSRPPTIARLMNAALENPALLSLAAGFTDNATLPWPAVQAAVETLAARGGREPLQYGPNQGRPLLRKLLAAHLGAWEPELSPAQLERGFLVTTGSQQALYLAMQVLCDPGDIVLVDRPSYFVFLEMLEAMGISAVSIPLNAAGRVDAGALADKLEELKQTGQAPRVKALYFVSYFSNPSSRSLTEKEKGDIAQALRSADLMIPVIEDAAYRDLYFSQAPAARSVLALPEWDGFARLYLSTLTKPFATGLKIGYGYCSEGGWLDCMLHTKGHHDFGSANFNQAILEVILAEGGLDRQLAVIRPAYERKMQALHDTLVEAGLPELGWAWNRPDGGLYLWLKAPAGTDTGLDGEFCRRCIEAGVLYVPGELCFGDEIPVNFVRLSYGVLGEDDLREAGRRFVQVARAFASAAVATGG